MAWLRAAPWHSHGTGTWEPVRRCSCLALPKRARSSCAEILWLQAALLAQRRPKGRAALLQH